MSTNSSAILDREGRLSAEQTDPHLQFLCLKSLSYARRMQIVAVLVGLGLVLQVIFLTVWPGVPFLFGALLASWVVGFDNKVDYRRLRHASNWETVAYKRLHDILRIDKQMRKWDESFFDVSNLAGGTILVMAVLLIGLATFVLMQTSTDLGLIFAVDCGLLLVFQWFNGMRRIHRQPDLVQCVKHLTDTADVFGILEDRKEKLAAQLLLRGKDEDNVPMGAKVVFTYPDGPDHFHGVQCQVVLNRVQGKPFPYCYAVLVAKEGHGLIEQTANMDLPRGAIRETQQKNGVDVVIVRQFTTKIKGYHTPVNTSRQILRAALRGAGEYVGS